MMNLTVVRAYVLLLAVLPMATAWAESEESEERTPPDNEACLNCHADADEVDEEYLVDKAHFTKGPHTEDNDVTCVGCHTKAAAVEDIEDHGDLGKASCEECHEIAEEVAAGAHGWKPAPGREQPTCLDCHGQPHQIAEVADPAAPVHPRNQTKMCGKCHNGDLLRAFSKDVHANLKGDKRDKAPSCGTCHGPHEVLAADLLHNAQFKRKLTRTCGSCHEEQWKVYRESIHGQALLEWNRAGSASCSDCHGQHGILPPDNPNSRTYKHHVSETCAECHADSRLIRRFKLKSDVVATYRESFHGRVQSFDDSAQSANCASCHDHHAVYPADDPRSTVHPDNLREACGKCHPGASRNFIMGKIHVPPSGQGNAWATMVRSAYLWIIALSCLGMLLHNVLDFRRKMKLRAKRLARDETVERMSLEARVSHAFFLTSFIALGYTGFAIMYPNAWWVSPIRWISSAESFRGLLHRVAGVIMITVTTWHVCVILFTRRGRKELGHLFPRLQDARDLVHNFLFFIGKREERPRFGRFGYAEKFEYWALVWGTFVMVVTGLILWFEEQSLQLMPLWMWEVFQIVHRYEAILAVASIIIWHLYHVLINPDEAPMSLVWLNGRIPIDELRELHPAEYDRLLKEGVIAADGRHAGDHDQGMVL
jgi:cytochrome b subunit of formate dehydrogenase